jgi:hypothetical protein
MGLATGEPVNNSSRLTIPIVQLVNIMQANKPGMIRLVEILCPFITHCLQKSASRYSKIYPNPDTNRGLYLQLDVAQDGKTIACNKDIITRHRHTVST